MAMPLVRAIVSAARNSDALPRSYSHNPRLYATCPIADLVMSLAYLWFGLTKPLRHLSMVAAVFKLLGTGGVTVFVFMTYPDQPLVLAPASLVTVLDIGYILLLIGRRASERTTPDDGAHAPAIVVENREPATA